MKYLIPLFIIIFWSCNENSPSNKVDDKPLIVTTTGIIKNSVKQLVNNEANVIHIDIISLLGPNSDPHLAKASKADLKKLSEADIIISNGLHLEGKLAEALDKFGIKKTHIKISDGIPDSLLLDADGVHDPHIWFDISIWSLGLKNTYSELTKTQLFNEQELSNSANKYFENLNTLNDSIKTVFDSYPKDNRVLITAHDAFRYLGKAYNVEVVGIQGVSTLSQTSIKHRQDLSNFIIERKIKKIFPETSVRDNQVKAIIEDCEAKKHKVEIGNKLYSDALGASDSPANSYINMIRYNVYEIVKAF